MTVLRPALLCLILAAPSVMAASKLVFNRDIRPILSDKCFHCHGFEEKTRKGDLRLDLRDAAMKPAKSGETAIMPGKPEESEVITRIMTSDADDVMPPPKSHKTLTAREKALFKQWIAEGAEYQGHWAFIKPQRAATPPAASGTKDPIDAFIQAELARHQLSPSPEADRSTLIRRVTLDLTGLPPTPQEVDAFLNDSSAHAYEKVVDRLLASEHYGETMAMQWLDFARYADSNGFQTDSSRQMWPWRDWVIKAFNKNLTYDQFTIEQLAGDLIPNAARDQIIATGFNRNHRINGEGGIIAEEWRIENIMDRVETTSATWLGLTMNCCRCHDHKYDPLSMKDFYSMFAFFNNVPENGTIQGASNRSGGNSEPTLLVPDAEDETQMALLKSKIDKAQAKVTETAQQLPNLVTSWEAEMETPAGKTKEQWKPLPVTDAKSSGRAALRKLDDGSYLAGGINPANDIYVVKAALPAGKLSGVLLEALPDPTLPGQSLGRAPNGNFVLTGFEASLTAPSLKQPVKLKFTRAEADYSQSGYDIKLLLDNNDTNGWAIDGNDPIKKVARKAMFLVDKTLTVPPDATLTVRLIHGAKFGNHNIGRFRLSTTDAEPALASLDCAGGPPPAILAILKTPTENRNPKQRTELEKYFRASIESPLREADFALASAKKAMDDLERSIPSVMIMKENTQPREAFVLSRGEYDKPTEKVSMATPTVLKPMRKDSPKNRLGLAQWIIDPENPLTARVWVNRLWEKFFGVGFCKTTENLGSQAEFPMHPELFDWLATEFISCNWDMKVMAKLVVMSGTYRQTSKVTPALIEKDPENRLLARGPRFRLTGEMVRDQALAIAGLLIPKVGGPSVKPYMPEGVWDDTSKYGDLRGYKADAGEGLYRRSFYTIWKRTAAPPTMMLFDAPTREVCTVKRSRTNTPLQALSLLNEVTFVEAARALGERMIQEGGTTPEQRITWAFKRALARTPSAEELQLLVTGLRQREADFTAKPEAAKQFLSIGSKATPANLQPNEAAAYGVTASIILNLNEVVTRP
jgi:hypothetical protein